MKNEQNRANLEGLTDEELELYVLLKKDKKLTKEKEDLLVVDWYKDLNTTLRVENAIAMSLNHDLPESYDKTSFENIILMILMHFIDMAVNSYGWISNKNTKEV